jgi:uncharacterized protein YcsI (UPF0317 family)
MRAIARRGEWRGSTGGQCPAYQQANLVILPKEAAAEFAAFCTCNPKPCPLIEITPPGDPEPARSAPGADIRTDLAGYRVYRHGQQVEKRGEIRELWRDDFVAFLLGCSLTFEHALIEAGGGRAERRARHLSADVRLKPSLPSCWPLPRTSGGDYAANP